MAIMILKIELLQIFFIIKDPYIFFIKNVVLIVDINCGGLLEDNSGNISIPVDYKMGENCTWHLNTNSTEIYIAVNLFNINSQDKVIFKMENETEIVTLSGQQGI